MKFHSIEDFGGADSSHTLFKSWGWTSVNNPDDADIIIFNGGADIGASIYGEKGIPGVPTKTSLRDEGEIDLFNLYKGNKFLLGICRGSQLLNCLNGGTLWQDVNGHGRSHDMIDLRTGEVVRVTSTHHQQMRPNLKDGVLIGVASQSTAKHADNLNEKFTTMGLDVLKRAIELAKQDAEGKPHTSHLPLEHTVDTMADVEIVWYPGTMTLCVQGHPEYVPGHRFAEYSRELILSCMDEVGYGVPA